MSNPLLTVKGIPAWTKTHWPTLTIVLATVLFFILLVVGLALVVGNSPSFDKPKTTTTVRVLKGPGARRQVTKIEWERRSPSRASGAPFRGVRKKTVNSKKEQPDGLLARRKRTSETHPRSFLESLTGDAGLYALQAAAVFLAAFVAAAMFQRVLIGNFRFKIGALDLNEPAALSAGVNATRYDNELTEALEALSKRMTVIETSLEKVVPADDDLRSELGTFEIKLPDARQHTERQSELYAWINARAGMPLLDANYFKSRISEPDEPSTPEKADPDDRSTEREQADS